MRKTISIQGLRDVSLEPQRGQSCEKRDPAMVADIFENFKKYV